MAIVCPQLAEDPGRVILELEIVLGRGRKLIADAAEGSGERRGTTTRYAHVKRVLVSRCIVFGREWPPYLRLTLRDLRGMSTRALRKHEYSQLCVSQ